MPDVIQLQAKAYSQERNNESILLKHNINVRVFSTIQFYLDRSKLVFLNEEN